MISPIDPLSRFELRALKASKDHCEFVMTDVSKRLGHVNPHVTATVYAHALPGRDDLAAAAWEKFQRESKPAKTAKARKTAAR